MQTQRSFPIATFNGLTETAMRLLIILETHYGQDFDFETLRLMDFFAVFSGDVDGPQSLHPVTSARGGAYNVRKTSIAHALDFLLAAGLISDENGVYSATNKDDGDPYRTRYLTGIQSASAWMKQRAKQIGSKAFTSEMRRTALSLAEESLSAQPPQADEMFASLKTTYESDILRLEGLQDASEIFQSLLEIDLKAASNDNGSVIPPFSYFEAVHAKATKEIVSTLSLYTGLLKLRPELRDTPTTTG
ncbi:ABC-three component system middle component 2 [Rhizobium sp. MHM7A]|uniref:ABC-three component system middle component 2 n=1 Tax=Rhizobium sp. MHM7A TaxID=2583233 RepID=UPI001105F8C0|nr:ABC-three component system middle component 2 [Rhizobium sp. MHM7A]TLX15879.1 hypothetical protein FFR93_00765 [Rhizobium sp. MHM7A]